MGASKLKMAPMKTVPRRPMRSLRGSDSQPALQALAETVSRCLGYEQKCDGHVWRAVDGANDPRISFTRASRCAFRSNICNAEGLGKRQVGTVGAGLIPSLNGSADGVQEYSEIQGFRVFPSVLLLCP